jgi:glucosamine kinase
MIVVTADAGGSRTRIRISDGDREIARLEGEGAAIRPGRALVSAGRIADLIRQSLATSGIVRAGAIVVGAAGAGSPPDADELRVTLVRDRIADRVVVTTDVMLALEALGSDAGAVLVAGTGSIALGRDAAGRLARQGGLGWRMGDEGSGYAIGLAALQAAGRAHDGRGPATGLTDALQASARVEDLRALAAWTLQAEAREIAGLVPAIVRAAESGDAVARGLLERAAADLVELVRALGSALGQPAGIPLGLTGGLLRNEGPIRDAVVGALAAGPFDLRPEPLDPLLGGPRLADPDRAARA